MAFQDDADRLSSRLHLTEVPRPLMAGAGAVLLLALLLGAFALGPLLTGGSFEITAADQAVPTAEEEGTGKKAPPGPEGQGGGAAGEAAPESAPVPGEEAAGNGAREAVAAPPAPLLCVHVDGAVNAPGVYYFEAGARIIDAVEAAGGFAKKACSAAINLAQVLEDGQQIVVPVDGEAPSAPPASSTGAAPSAGAPGSGTGPKSAGAGEGRVNINRASAAELVTLSGVGEATAAKIIADREANGPFASIEDLTRVSGIGEKKLEALRDFICV